MQIRKFLTFGFLVYCLNSFSCVQNAEKKQQAISDTIPATSDTINLKDTIQVTFNADNEFLGLGIAQFGDLDSMIARRKIRALVPYTQLYYYIDGKERKGIAFEALNIFEQSLNKKLNFKQDRVRVIFIPVPRNQVIDLLRDGYGDVAYAGMTITEERKKLVDFSMPSITGLKEIVVGGPTSKKLNSLSDLSGQEIYLHTSSSYETAIRKLNDSLKQQGLPPVIIKPIDPYLESEDMLQMVNSGMIPFTATVEDVARLWTKVMNNLVLYNQIPLATNISYGMLMRQNSPKFKNAANDFIKQNAKGTMMGNVLYNRYVKNVKLNPDMHSKKTIEQVKTLRSTFHTYADKYELDWLLLTAQGYQESGLDQQRVSHVGAIGIMQVMPATAAGSPLYIKNINVVDNNVHAGVKYMRFLIDRYFNDPGIDRLNRQLLALAAYNCGPGRVIQLRRMAKEKGLNPNLWFDHVEIIAAQEIGRETVQYVSNIYKFYASYRALDYYISQRGRKLIE